MKEFDTSFIAINTEIPNYVNFSRIVRKMLFNKHRILIKFDPVYFEFMKILIVLKECLKNFTTDKKCTARKY